MSIGWSIHSASSAQQTIFNPVDFTDAYVSTPDSVQSIRLISKTHNIFTSTLAIPLYLAAASAFILLVHIVSETSLVRKLFRRQQIISAEEPLHGHAQPENLVQEVKSHIKAHGGPAIYAYMVSRFLGCLTLLGLSLATLLIDLEGRADTVKDLGKWAKKHPKNKPLSDHFSDAELLEAAMTLTFFYTSFLALISVIAKSRWSRVTIRHANTILLAAFCVYFYRDVYPLITYTLDSIDLSEGAILWAKLVVLTLTAIFIPLFIPRQYIPIDPKNPLPEPNPEQTASIFSMACYTFLDPLVYAAFRVTHLAYSQLPPLNDRDTSEHLKDVSFKHLDSFSGAPKRHLFFGLMRIFRQEYIQLSIMIILHVFSNFAAPIGLNMLLRYLEPGGKEEAIVRPWFWILWLFLGPVSGTIAIQYYIFIATRTLVRTQAIITQLVFEHALRIRVKAETADSVSTAVASFPPDTPSPDSDSLGEGTTDGSDTLHSISPSSGEAAHSTSGSVSSTTISKSTRNKKPQKNGKASSSSESSKSSASNLVGKINNLVSTDLDNVTDGRDFLFVVLYIPVQIALCIIFLYYILGWSSFVGLAVIVFSLPLPGIIAKGVQMAQERRLKKTDARVQAVSESMNVLRMIKLFGWESKMEAKIAEKRNEELVWIRIRQLLEIANDIITYVIPVLTMVATFLAYVRNACACCSKFTGPENLHNTMQTIFMKQTIKASIIFSSMTVFDMLRDQMRIIFRSVNDTMTAKVSLDRISNFLKHTELLDAFSEKAEESEYLVPADMPPDSNDIGFRNADFVWSEDADGSLTPSKRGFMLRIEGSLLFKRDCVNLIVGETGSGKTSLLMALLSEMHFVPSGPDSWYNLPREGGIAYSAQESWVQNETIRDNIIFGSPFDEERYNKVIYQCGLERDISIFEAGDATEIGEKGLSLSGGQRARVTLARAIYSDAKIILLDDVLAALDVHTSKWIVDKCFSGDLMKNRTVILVTHNVAITRSIAEFVVAMKDGRIESQGTVSEALSNDPVLADEESKDQQIIDKTDEEVDVHPPAGESKGDGKLIMAEEIQEGHVSWSAVKMYLTSMGGEYSWTFFVTFILALFFGESLNAFITWWLGLWASRYETRDPTSVNVSYYIGVYCVLLAIQVAIYTLGIFVYIFGTIRASRSIHKQLIASILGTTLRWLDTTPTSRILTRCTQDTRAVDGPVAMWLQWVSEISVSMIMKYFAVILFSPIFFFPGLLVLVLGAACGQVYIKAQLSVKREMSNARAPVLAHFGAAIAGLTSIRAYGAQARFKNESLNRINKFTRAARTFYNLNRWVCIRIDVLGGFLAAGLAAYLVYYRGQTASNTGFSLNMAVGFSSMILWWEIGNLERVQGYINIEQEPKPSASGVPPAYWPASGELRVDKLSARYSSDGPKVLHDISFHIRSGERIGVVGRTGSGKSSLTLSLLRCIFTEGTVYYDGMPTDKINLDALRSNITIIPQIPELLSGSLRQNLDPFDQYDDATLNDALRAAGLFALQSEMNEGRITLDSPIASGGGNLSVGQRQILALARALVRGSKLLILDEATSAIDYKTDSIIQDSLRNELKGDVTLITIAHRLQTIMDADKIMVLDDGRIVEFDSPRALLKIKNGKLRSLVDESNDRKILYAIAEKEH
ncbi:hypothetical protein D9757_006267 [Collybiopsis confluens]|uniref:ATP-binding cassette transporter n=1 Tax=Collybiopsis confluens TaxID=2823264 RepID=A0A8H5M8M6_9AGAR|nr:hypothetical protein D9757_006267 [Collybiopsis confluens]